MLTGRETVPATFAATGHLHRAAPAALEARPDAGVVTTVWGALVARVRAAALALAADGARPGMAVALDPAAPRRERVVTVLVASVVGAVVTTGDGPLGGAALDLARLAADGAAIDDRWPDRYERLVAERSAGDPLLRNGDVVHTSGTLLVAARSLAQAAGVGAGDRVMVDLTAGSAAEVVAGLLIPCLTGAATWSAGEGVDVGAVAPGHAATLVLTAGRVADGLVPDGPAAGPVRRRRRASRRRVPPGHRTVVVAGDGGGRLAAPSDGATALAVEGAGGIVTGFGRAGTLGRPLPGASVAVDDDGSVLVRSHSVPPDAPGRRDDGWLATGLTGDLEDGNLVVSGGGGLPAPA